MWLDGYADEDAGITRWRAEARPGPRCAIRGTSFSAAINNDQGLYVPRAPTEAGGSATASLLTSSASSTHPLTLAVLERANPINEASLRNQPTTSRSSAAPRTTARSYHGQRRAALAERTRLQALGGHALAAQHPQPLRGLSLVAIERVDQGAIAAAIDRGDAAAVVTLLKPVADAITLGIKRIGDALDAGRAAGKDWRAVANKAGDDLRAICEPRLAILPPETDIVPRGVALATLEEKAMQDAGWLVPAGRAVPNASGFAASAPRRRASPARGGSAAARSARGTAACRGSRRPGPGAPTAAAPPCPAGAPPAAAGSAPCPGWRR